MAGLLLLVIFLATEIVMDNRFSRGGFMQILFVEVVFEDRLDVLVTVCLQKEGATAGRL
jgi:hypothetical protein